MSEAPMLVDAGRQQAAGVAVARMFEERSRTLYGLCRMLLRDPHEAEDALQATFLAAHGAILRGGVPRDEAAWLATIARNECRGRIRDRMRGPLNTGDEALESAPDPGLGPEERLEDPNVKKALAQLPESQREAVVLHDVFGLKAREVGTALGMSVPAVEALLFRGRRQLRLRLRPAQGALIVPVDVREALSLAIPGFASPDAAVAAAGGAGIAGAGLLAKLAGAPAAAKVAAGVVAIATTGSVAAVETRRAEDTTRPRAEQPRIVSASALSGGGAAPQTAGASGSSSSGTGSRSDGGGQDDTSGPGGGEGGASGPDGGSDDVDEPGADRSAGPGGDGGSRDDRSSGTGPGGDDRPGRNGDDRSGKGGDDAPTRSESNEARAPDDSSGPGSGEEPSDDDSSSSGGPGGGEEPKDEPATAEPASSGSGSGSEPEGDSSGTGSGSSSSSGSGSGSGSDPEQTGLSETPATP